MALSKDQEDLYRKTMDEAKKQMEDINTQMEKEIQKTRQKLADLQESKGSFRQMYEGAATVLGVPVELEEEEGKMPRAPKPSVGQDIQLE